MTVLSDCQINECLFTLFVATDLFICDKNEKGKKIMSQKEVVRWFGLYIIRYREEIDKLTEKGREMFQFLRFSDGFCFKL